MKVFTSSNRLSVDRLVSTWCTTFRALPPYAPASAVTLIVLCAIEGVIVGAAADAWAWLVLCCLACIMGAAYGLTWQLAFTLLSPLPTWLLRLFWPGALLALGTWLADQLGAFARLGTRHHHQAIGVLLALAASALAAGFLLSSMQPTRELPGGALSAAHRTRQVAVIVVLLAACVLLFYVDARYYVGLYPTAHRALRHASLSAGMLVVALAGQLSHVPRVRLRWLAVGLALLGVTLGVGEAVAPRSLGALYRAQWAGEVIRAAQRAADGDRDGYSALLGGGDCDDFNADVHPGAREIAGNGIDDNCMLGDRQLSPESVDVVEPAQRPVQHDVVLITIDTLRPDHLGIYSPKYGPKGRATSPNLDRWAADAHVFRNAFTTGAWTILALSSLMRGVHPRRIEWTPHYETSLFRLIEENEAKSLLPGETLLQMFLMPSDDPHVALATLLKRRGMRTIAIVDDGYSAMLQAGGGLDAGFDEYIYMRSSSLPADQATVNRALSVLRRQRERQHFFLWVHLFGPHSPNEPRPNVKVYGPSIIDGYDHEVRFMDEQLGRLLGAVSSRKPQPIVIVTGDHGEFFSPTNRWHGYSLEEDTMRIPLLVKVPTTQGASVDATVSIVDLFPTILALTDTPGPKSIDGVDLTPLLSGRAPSERIVLTDCWRYSGDPQLVMDVVGATDGESFVFYDRMTAAAHRAQSGKRGVQFIGSPSMVNDPLVRVVLGYLEEVRDLPQ